MYIPGATALGIVFKDGVVLGADKRFAYGNFLLSRSSKKVFLITNNVGAACAGMISDMQNLIKRVTVEIKLRELEIKRPVPPNSVAKLMSVIMFSERLYPLLTQVIVGGIDERPSVYVLDPLGSIIPDEYATVGSGTEIAIGIIESEYKKGMDEKAATELAIKALKAAMQRDIASGDGIDLLIIKSNENKEQEIKFQ
ncbi:proteasome subunit beta [Caldisericum sp.]|uniref:proteasome subunit beta n=1 Tax=Caldisericum sp. TaxID=2499687 RepID=UPI003CB021A7